MGMQSGSGGDQAPMSEINVTPMVDVMLVLLIIFMVTAPMMQTGIDVNLPTTKGSTIEVDDQLSILTITKKKKVFLGDTQIPFSELKEKLVANLKLKEDKEVYLNADRDLPYGTVVDVMGILKSAGVTNLGMVTNPDGKKR